MAAMRRYGSPRRWCGILTTVNFVFSVVDGAVRGEYKEASRRVEGDDGGDGGRKTVSERGGLPDRNCLPRVDFGWVLDCLCYLQEGQSAYRTSLAATLDNTSNVRQRQNKYHF